MKSRQLARQMMQPQRGMKWVGLQNLQGLQVLPLQLRVAFEKSDGPLGVLFGEYKGKTHACLSGAALPVISAVMRLTCDSADALTKRPSARSALVWANAVSSSHSRR